MAVKRIRKSVSLMPETIELAQKKADEMFNGNFSIYLTYLINKDNKEIQAIENQNKYEENKIDNDVSESIDNILGI